MNPIPPKAPAPLELPPDKMSPVHMAALVVGVLLGVAGVIVIAVDGSFLVGLALLVAGLVLILVGAAGLGRGLHPQHAPIDAAYPAHLAGQLDPTLSRGLWLVKWLLAIPHYLVLAILWIAFLVITVAAGFTILFTGRYPVSLFQFSVGVLRWNWRVAFYAYGALGTDRYPPFTLARTDHPATFDVDYPEKLSNWRVLVKSWLFALPHLLVVAALTGGGSASSTEGAASGISLLGLLVLIAGVILLFTGVYRRGLFDLLMGINRWVYRVTAYVALMRDEYPPFRLDQGALDPPTVPTER